MKQQPVSKMTLETGTFVIRKLVCVFWTKVEAVAYIIAHVTNEGKE